MRRFFFAIVAILLFPSLADARPLVTSENPTWDSSRFAKSEPSFSPRIVGGQTASRPYPWMAYLQIQTAQGSAACGASAISQDWVVTAAHCALPAQSAVLSIGVSNLADVRNSDIYQADAAYVNPSYSEKTQRNDVALLHLSRPYNGPTLRLLESGDNEFLKYGLTARVLGWGLDKDASDGGRVQDKLRELDVKLINSHTCKRLWGASTPGGDKIIDPTTMLCASGGVGRDSCQGDSGGPLLVKDGVGYALSGVVSFGQKCANGVPAVYTRTSGTAINNWIRSRADQVEIDYNGSALVARSTNNTVYTTFLWDTDGDGQFDDGSGQSIAFHTTGKSIVAVQASNQTITQVRRLVVPRTKTTLSERTVAGLLRSISAKSKRFSLGVGINYSKAKVCVSAKGRSVKGKKAFEKKTLLKKTCIGAASPKNYKFVATANSQAKKYLKCYGSVPTTVTLSISAPSAKSVVIKKHITLRK